MLQDPNNCRLRIAFSCDVRAGLENCHSIFIIQSSTVGKMKKTLSANVILPLFAAFLLVPASRAADKIIFVDVDATSAKNGSSWPDAHICLQDALNAARYGDEIRVARGIYRPDQRTASTQFGPRIISSGDRHDTFQLKNGVAIKGGYAGFGERNSNERNIQSYDTALFTTFTRHLSQSRVMQHARRSRSRSTKA